MPKFANKTWNDNVFEKYTRQVPRTKENALIKNGLYDNKPNTRARLTEQVGGNYFTEPIKGLLDGEVQNYDGKTDVKFDSRDTFEQGKVVIGRMKGWEENDFASDLTGVDWMANMAQEIQDYYDEVDQADILAILKGIFSMSTGNENKDGEWVKEHTLEKGEADLTATDLNTALTVACGDKKKECRTVFMHSLVALPLENLNLIEFLKYTDAQGITRDLSIGQWNGRLVVVDDEMPYDDEKGYTTYVLGDKFFEYDNIPLVKNPAFELVRDAVKNGGMSKVVTRRRKLIAPKYISFTKKSMASDSPTVTELANGENWTIVNNGQTGEQLKLVAGKMIPAVRIFSNKKKAE